MLSCGVTQADLEPCCSPAVRNAMAYFILLDFHFIICRVPLNTKRVICSQIMGSKALPREGILREDHCVCDVWPCYFCIRLGLWTLTHRSMFTEHLLCGGCRKIHTWRQSTDSFILEKPTGHAGHGSMDTGA